MGVAPASLSHGEGKLFFGVVSCVESAFSTFHQPTVQLDSWFVRIMHSNIKVMLCNICNLSGRRVRNKTQWVFSSHKSKWFGSRSPAKLVRVLIPTSQLCTVLVSIISCFPKGEAALDRTELHERGSRWERHRENERPGCANLFPARNIPGRVDSNLPRCQGLHVNCASTSA